MPVSYTHLQERILLEKGSGKVTKVLDRAIVGACPVHRKFIATLIPLQGIGKVASVGTIGCLLYTSRCV